MFSEEADVDTINLRMELIKRIGEDIIYLSMAFMIKFKDKFTL